MPCDLFCFVALSPHAKVTWIHPGFVAEGEVVRITTERVCCLVESGTDRRLVEFDLLTAVNQAGPAEGILVNRRVTPKHPEQQVRRELQAHLWDKVPLPPTTSDAIRRCLNLDPETAVSPPPP